MMSGSLAPQPFVKVNRALARRKPPLCVNFSLNSCTRGAAMDDAQAILIALATFIVGALLFRYFRLVREGRKHIADLEAKHLDQLRSRGAWSCTTNRLQSRSFRCACINFQALPVSRYCRESMRQYLRVEVQFRPYANEKRMQPAYSSPAQPLGAGLSSPDAALARVLENLTR
jgi:hypothetical protein